MEIEGQQIDPFLINSDGETCIDFSLLPASGALQFSKKFEAEAGSSAYIAIDIPHCWPYITSTPSIALSYTTFEQQFDRINADDLLGLVNPCSDFAVDVKTTLSIFDQYKSPKYWIDSSGPALVIDKKAIAGSITLIKISGTLEGGKPGESSRVFQ